MKKLSLKRKVQIGLLLPLFLSSFVILQLLYVNMKSFVTDEVKQGLKGQIEIMYEPMVDKYKLLKIGVIKEKSLAYSEAQRIVKDVKFGKDKTDYFWLLGGNEKQFLAHPLAKFQGKAIDSFKDHNGKKTFSNLFSEIKNGKTEGFFFYKGINAHNPSESVDKVAYYKYFKEWNWILGTELNLQSIYSKSFAEVTKFGVYFLITTILLFSLVTFILNKAAIGPLSYVISKLEQTTNDVKSNSNKVFTSTEKMSSASTEQSSNLQQTVTAVDEISAMVERNSNSAQESKKIGQESEKSAEIGLQNIKSMVKAMDSISKTNETTSEKMNDSINRINEVLDIVKQIGAKTDVINDIVFQTKLLSFNASVEAARAGEAGKGFAVVAEEVGNLAAMSGKASEEIASLLSDSIVKVESTVEHINKTTEQIIKQSNETTSNAEKNADECKKSFDHIMQNVRQLNTRVDEIARASSEQNTGVSEISDAMRRLDSLTQESNQIVIDTEDASKILSEESGHLDSVVRNITKIVKGA